MKKCPCCGMSNGSMNTICLNCWQRLDQVNNDASLVATFPKFIGSDPLLNAGHRAGLKVLNSKHDPTFRASTIMLVGIFLVLILASAGYLDLSLFVLAGTIVITCLFVLIRRYYLSM